MNKPKPCICGTIVHVERDVINIFDNTPIYYVSIFCSTCHNHMGDCIKDETVLVENWNNWVKNNEKI